MNVDAVKDLIAKNGWGPRGLSLVDSHQFTTHPHRVETIPVAVSEAIRGSLKVAILKGNREVHLGNIRGPVLGIELAGVNACFSICREFFVRKATSKEILI